MKSIYLTVFLVLPFMHIFAGGILTNTNQSAMFTRMQARDASTEIDAVYYNPAGLSFLPNNGLFLSVNNQLLGQKRTITSDYAYLNKTDYYGDIWAPVFPGLYAAYKINNFVFSAGFNPIGGGGGGTYNEGLPFFEYSIADLVPTLTQYGVSDYQVDAYFEGSSAYFGYQANISYQINDILSVAIGGRYVQAKESYIGHLKDINLNINGAWTPAHLVMLNLAEQANAGAASASGAATNMQPLINNGAGTLTFEQAEENNFIDANTRAQLEGGLQLLGINPTALTIAQAQSAYTSASERLTTTAQKSAGTANLLRDQNADYEKTAWGITPIISIDFKPSDRLNISFKYEHKTRLEFENATTSDFQTGYDENGLPVTMFPDGYKANLDLPSQIVLGATFKPFEKLMLSSGFHAYLDKKADWDGREDLLEGNSWEFAFGAEYDLNETLLVSAGWLMTQSGAKGAYQTGLSYSLPSNTFGTGFAYSINDQIELNLAGSYTFYQKGERTFEHNFAGSGNMVPITESYDKNVWIASLGINYMLNK